MGAKKSFLVYFSWENALNLLNNEEMGVLFRAIFSYAQKGKLPDFEDRVLLSVFYIIKEHIDRDMNKYDEICKKRSSSGKLGGRPPKVNAFSENQMLSEKAKEADKEKDKYKYKDRVKEKYIENEKEFMSSSSFSGKTACEYDEVFLSFWAEYPKKVGKGEAYRQWKKQGLGEDDLTALKSALQWQKGSREWLEAKGRFVPNPSTYLSQRRWEDEPSQVSCITDITNPSAYNDGDVLPEYILGEVDEYGRR